MTRFKINMASGMVASTVNLGIQLILIPIALNHLGPETYGLWSTLSILTVFGILANQGLADALTRAIALHKGKLPAEQKISNDYLSATILIGCFIALCLGIALYASSNLAIKFLNIKEELTAQSTALAKALSIIPALIITDNIAAAYITGLGRYDIVNYTRILSYIIRLVSTLLTIWLTNSIWSMYVGIASMYATTSIFLILFGIHKSNSTIRPKLTFRNTRIREVIHFSSNIFFAKALNLSFDPAIRIIIAKYIGISEVGYYNISMRFVYAFQNIIRTGISAYLPHATESLKDARQGISALKSQSNKLALTTFSSMIASYAAFHLIGVQIIKFWTGNSYNILIPTSFSILFIGYIVNTSTYPYVISYLALNKSKYLFHNNITMFLTLWISIWTNLHFTAFSYNNLLWCYTFSIILASIHAYISYRISCNGHQNSLIAHPSN